MEPFYYSTQKLECEKPSSWKVYFVVVVIVLSVAILLAQGSKREAKCYNVCSDGSEPYYVLGRQKEGHCKCR